MHGKPSAPSAAAAGVPSVGGESRSCLARVMPSTTGSTASRCEGLEARVIGKLLAGAAVEHPPGALVVLHVARALDGLGVEVALELLEDLPVGLAHDVGQHVQPAAMRHAHDDLGHAGAGGGVEQRVEQHDGRLGTLEAEALLPDVAGVEKALEDLGRVQPVEDVALLLVVERRRLALDVLLDPTLLLGVLDVHVLDAQRPAVGVAQHVEDLVERGDVAAGQAVGDEVPGQVPDGQPVGERVELGVDVRRLGVEGVEVGDEVPAHPVHVDERLHVHLLDQPLVLALFGALAGVVVHLPAHRLVGHAHRLEQVVVEAVGAGQEGGHPAEEEARLGPLDDPVVVGRGERDHLAQAELGQHARVGRLEPGRVPERADADDGALARHEPRHRLHRAERARVGQRHRRPGEVVGRDLVGVDLADQVLVGHHEGAEVERVGVLDARHQQGAAAVALLLVDREPEPHVLVMDDARLARPSASATKAALRAGTSCRARTTAYPMMWVKLTLAPVVRASWLLRIRRLTSSRRAGTVRTLVAVGTPRLASMFATIREAAPRSGVASSTAAASLDDGPGRGGRAAPPGGGRSALGAAGWGGGAGTGAGR